MNSPRKTLLYATAAIWMVCDTGSRGKKSSDALTIAVCFELQYGRWKFKLKNRKRPIKAHA